MTRERPMCQKTMLSTCTSWAKGVVMFIWMVMIKKTVRVYIYKSSVASSVVEILQHETLKNITESFAKNNNNKRHTVNTQNIHT